MRHGVLTLLPPEIIDNQIMRDPVDPGHKLTAIGIALLLYGGNHFNKGVLKNIFGQLPVTYNEVDIRINFILMPVHQYSKSIVITPGIKTYQLFICFFQQINRHYFQILEFKSKSWSIGRSD